MGQPSLDSTILGQALFPFVPPAGGGAHARALYDLYLSYYATFTGCLLVVPYSNGCMTGDDLQEPRRIDRGSGDRFGPKTAEPADPGRGLRARLTDLRPRVFRRMRRPLGQTVETCLQCG